ncbi:sugar/nucleoside kinase (ribokinase family) [Nonomuraea thailandensis]|uniref:Sugar/nucleoside kinase (Ribokinase family) n=1 Tax=Nonomuraea thailandensis TaxID=1188745 RepID=A0A9X2GMI4_9ACTN|nr:carbohydrate kinase family protein [Nonomuraea thailandensis]MCP2357348.1 sugar/nucleoside kinase (ribokinase family) [Nonomuraea thailandensis]
MSRTTFDLLVVGDANPDVIVSGSPRHPEFGQREQLVPAAGLVLGGSGAITAYGAARLGLRTAFAGRVGDDPAGAFVLDALRGGGVDVSACVVDPGVPTAMTVVLVDGDDRAILTAPGCLDRLAPADVPPGLLERAAHVHVSSYFLQPLLAAGLAGLFGMARAAGASTSLDTNDDPAGRWAGLAGVLPVTDVLLPNENEALAIARAVSGAGPGAGTGVGAGADDDADLERAVKELAARGTLPVVKRGERGALAFADGELVEVPARPATVVDAVGAGDSFNAGLLAALLRGLPLSRGMSVAVTCGTLSTRAAGGTAAQPTWEEATS